MILEYPKYPGCEASDNELRFMLKTVAEKVTGERRSADFREEDVDGLTRRILAFQLDRRRPLDEQAPQGFGPM